MRYPTYHSLGIRKFPACCILAACFILNTLHSVVRIDDFEQRLFDPDNDPGTFNMPSRLFVPHNHDPAKKYPLIIYLHGLGSGNGDNLQQMGDHGHGGMHFAEDEQQAYEASFVLLPQEPGGTSKRWHQSPTRELLEGLIDDLLNEYPSIDTDRIIIGGISMGGLGTWDHYTRNPNKYAAAVLLAGAGGNGNAGNINHKPIWLWHADTDGVVGVGSSRNRVDALRNVGGSVIYSEMRGFGHAVGPDVCKNMELYRWMMEQNLNEAPQGEPIVRITEYSIGSNLDIKGVAMEPAMDFSAVEWTNSAGGSGTAAGTSTWSVDDIALTGGANMINIIARAASYYDLDVNGETNFSQALEINYTTPTGDTTPPSIVIAAPSHSDNRLNSVASQVTFSGSASDDTGISTVSWATDRGHSGTATGTTSWSADIDLEPGLNRLTLSAEDAAGNRHAQVFYIQQQAVPTNEAPRILAGPDILASLPDDTVDLDASLGDDALPSAATITWSKQSGPGTVTFGDASAVDTTATFSEAGIYVLRVTADDTEKSAYDETTVVITEMPVAKAGAGVLGINCHGDDYLASDGTQYYSDLNGTGTRFRGAVQTSTNVVVGTDDPELYQTGVAPRGTVIWSDYELPNGEYIVTLKLMTPSNAIGRRYGDYYIEGYRVLNDLDVREYVLKDTALDFDFRITITDGTLDFQVFSEQEKPWLCAVLVREAVVGPPVNSAPVVDAGPDQTVALANGATLAGLVDDDGFAPGDPVATTTWRMLDGPGTVQFANANAVATTVEFSAAGTYVLELFATDNALSSTDTVTINVTHQVPTVPGRSVYFDFGTQLVPDGNWNNSRFPADDPGIVDAIDSEGASTPYDLKVTGNFRSRDRTGQTATGLFPDDASYDSLYVNTNLIGEVTISDLDPAKSYDLTIFASGDDPTAVCQYTIGTTVLTLNATNNATETVTFEAMQPSPDGTLVLRVQPAPGNGEAYINVLVLSEAVDAAIDYGAWIYHFYQSHSGDPAYVARNSDPDRDGLSNLMEYALGVNPRKPNSHPTQARWSGGKSSLRFYRPAEADINYQVEASSTLLPGSWEVIASLAAGQSTWSGSANVSESGEHLMEVIVEDSTGFPSSGESVRFYRLNVLED